MVQPLCVATINMNSVFLTRSDVSVCQDYLAGVSLDNDSRLSQWMELVTGQN